MPPSLRSHQTPSAKAVVGINGVEKSEPPSNGAAVTESPSIEDIKSPPSAQKVPASAERAPVACCQLLTSLKRPCRLGLVTGIRLGFNYGHRFGFYFPGCRLGVQEWHFSHNRLRISSDACSVSSQTRSVSPMAESRPVGVSKYRTGVGQRCFHAQALLLHLY